MLGLGLKAATDERVASRYNGYIQDVADQWKVALGSETGLDDLTGFTIILFGSWNCTGKPSNLYGSIFSINSAFQALGSSGGEARGFQLDFHSGAGVRNSSAGNSFSPSINVGEGDSAAHELIIAGRNSIDGDGVFPGDITVEGLNRWGGRALNSAATGYEDYTGYKATSSKHFAVIARYDASATNDTSLAILNNQGIRYDESNSGGDNTGTIGGEGITLSIGGANTGWSSPTLNYHKISLWKSALSDSVIARLCGLRNTTLKGDAAGDVFTIVPANLNGGVRMASRNTSYSTLNSMHDDITITAPNHEWDFTSIAPGYYSSGNIEDTGSTGGLDLAATNSPYVGRDRLDPDDGNTEG